jgi:glucose-1-phosphate cytidylyltransferase
MTNLRDIPVFILCGGFGTRIKVSEDSPPKPMVKIGRHPVLFHVIQIYLKFGFRKFILCAGYKYEVITDFFNTLVVQNSDVTFSFQSKSASYNDIKVPTDFEVTVVDTGLNTMTGARLAIALDKYLGSSTHFALTYGDGLCDVDISKEFEHHLNSGKIGTVLGVNPTNQFGKMEIEGDLVKAFLEKPKLVDEWINGGYFFFKKDFRNYLSLDSNCVLEQKPLENLANDNELQVFRHLGFWQCMDTYKDWEYLNKEFHSGNAKWI